uniref:Uncharacterized protein n=1 Tax=Arundo donax TaxID=35708 RepID=A0A0A9A6L5_ARUDO
MLSQSETAPRTWVNIKPTGTQNYRQMVNNDSRLKDKLINLVLI